MQWLQLLVGPESHWEELDRRPDIRAEFCGSHPGCILSLPSSSYGNSCVMEGRNCTCARAPPVSGLLFPRILLWSRICSSKTRWNTVFKTYNYWTVLGGSCRASNRTLPGNPHSERSRSSSNS